MGDKLTDEAKFLVGLGAENVRWLYDVRDKLFRFYLVFVAVLIGAIKLGDLEASEPAFALLVVVFLGVTYAFVNQIIRQRQLIDGEREILRRHLRGVEVPALFYEATGESIWHSTTFGYLRLLLFAFAIGTFFVPLPLLQTFPLTPEFGLVVQTGLAILAYAVGWCVLKRKIGGR